MVPVIFSQFYMVANHKSNSTRYPYTIFTSIQYNQKYKKIINFVLTFNLTLVNSLLLQNRRGDHSLRQLSRKNGRNG